ncbi:TPA: type IV toxin-antitoxin system YeeU family antitoxin [Yersinia enterocolitica]|nr:type IV toxin-antitoxin system YeeU family antitoxin [Yersinia enterocolitica]
MKQPERLLLSGELNPRHRRSVTLKQNGLTCDADTLESHGYVYIVIYLTPPVAT